MQVRRAAAPDLHRRIGTMARLGPASRDAHRPVVTTDALLSGQHEEGLGTRMSMHGVMLPGGPLASLMRRRYCGATTLGMGPNSATLAPPADDPPAGPSVKSQTLPADPATNAQGPAAACACASTVKFSILQKSSPAGNSAVDCGHCLAEENRGTL